MELKKLRRADFLPVVYAGNSAESGAKTRESALEAEDLISRRRGFLRTTIQEKLLAAYNVLAAVPSVVRPYSNRRRYPVAVFWEDFKAPNSTISLRRRPGAGSTETDGNYVFVPDVVFYDGKYYDYIEIGTDAPVFGEVLTMTPDLDAQKFRVNVNYVHPVVSYGARQYSAVKTVEQRDAEKVPNEAGSEFWEPIEDLREFFGLDSASYVFTLVDRYGQESRPSHPSETKVFNLGDYLSLEILPTVSPDSRALALNYQGRRTSRIETRISFRW